MLILPPSVHIYLAADPADMRRGFDGLSYLVREFLGAGVVLTGGTAMLAGIRELAEQIFDMPVRIGFPSAVDGLVEVVNHPRFATGVGLLHTTTDVSKEVNRAPSSRRIQRSFSQIKRAIASFI